MRYNRNRKYRCILSGFICMLFRLDKKIRQEIMKFGLQEKKCLYIDKIFGYFSYFFSI